MTWPKSDCSQRIFTILLRRGRLSIHTLAQHTRLNRRQLRHGLIVLIQQNLIYYVEEGPQATYYEANRSAAYGLIRSGKILDIVDSRYGSVARDMVLNLFLLGHAKVGALIDLCQLNRSPTVNGDSSAHVASHTQRQTPAQLDSILCDLLEAGLLEPVTDLTFRSPDDTFNEVEQKLLKTEFTGGTKGTKQKELLKTRIREELATLRSEKQKWKSNSNKRKLEGAHVNGTNGNAKRRRFSNGSLAVNGNHADENESLRLEVGCSSCYSRTCSRANSALSVTWPYASTMRNSQSQFATCDSLSWPAVGLVRPLLRFMQNYCDSSRKKYHGVVQIVTLMKLMTSQMGLPLPPSSLLLE